MRRTILTLAAALAAVPASAQVPEYDTARHCAEFAKGNQTVETQCRRDEADARRELEKIRLPQEVWSACEKDLQTQQSYVLLFGCTLNEAEAIANRRPIAPIPVGPLNPPAVNAPAADAPAPLTNAPAATDGGAGRLPAPVPPAGSITVMRGSETTIEKPPRR